MTSGSTTTLPFANQTITLLLANTTPPSYPNLYVEGVPGASKEVHLAPNVWSDWNTTGRHWTVVPLDATNVAIKCLNARSIPTYLRWSNAQPGLIDLTEDVSDLGAHWQILPLSGVYTVYSQTSPIAPAGGWLTGFYQAITPYQANDVGVWQNSGPIMSGSQLLGTGMFTVQTVQEMLVGHTIQLVSTFRTVTGQSCYLCGQPSTFVTSMVTDPTQKGTNWLVSDLKDGTIGLYCADATTDGWHFLGGQPGNNQVQLINGTGWENMGTHWIVGQDPLLGYTLQCQPTGPNYRSLGWPGFDSSVPLVLADATMGGRWWQVIIVK